MARWFLGAATSLVKASRDLEEFRYGRARVVATLSNDEIVRGAADELPDGIWIARAPGGEFVYANRAFREIMGIEGRSDVAVGEYAAPYGIHTRTGELYPEHRMPFVRALEARATVIVDDIVIHRPDGGRVYIRAQARPVFFPTQDVISHVVIAFIDITREVAHEAARAEAEARLARAHRMESVGSLAGGVAHDFNNLLAVVRLLTSSLRRTERDALRLEDLRSIDEVIDSAAALTRSLLAFAGRGKTRSERVSLDAIAGSILEILGRAVDKRIAVRSELMSRADVVGDGSQLEQVLMNLVVNARDALPDTGTILVKTYRLDVDDAEARRLGRLAPGEHVALEVHDDGTGIDPSIRDRIFEPYFTTKARNKGTGLGLATVHGVVQQAGGEIRVDSAPGEGTTFYILLPATEQVSEPRPVLDSSTSTATILVVDDDDNVRRATERILRSAGYAVLSASSGHNALAFAREHAGTIDLLLTDIVMPGLSGRDLAREILVINPAQRVLFMSGYHQHAPIGESQFISKPFQRADLLEKVRTVLATEVARVG